MLGLNGWEYYFLYVYMLTYYWMIQVLNKIYLSYKWCFWFCMRNWRLKLSISFLSIVSALWLSLFFLWLVKKKVFTIKFYWKNINIYLKVSFSIENKHWFVNNIYVFRSKQLNNWVCLIDKKKNMNVNATKTIEYKLANILLYFRYRKNLICAILLKVY
jgi:hypothetical protein